MKTLKQQLREANFQEITTVIIIGHIKEWLTQKRKEIRGTLKTQHFWENTIDELLEELSEC